MVCMRCLKAAQTGPEELRLALKEDFTGIL